MDQEMLNVLALPLLFSMIGGTYVFVHFRDRRPNALLVVTLFQLVGAYGYTTQPSEGLFGLLVLHAVVVFALLLRHLQTPALATDNRDLR
ncbi:hypothetical protein [Deinococcus aerophilus]|uniref:Uncharacterized protein n=1 Tax=Deinococcus aerophilus TaxID=522488 RepID=A0ABQ2GN12_9DEIO|nr:hypothetical protein [Deinococcus aerophilus]GGM04555.1 hypothetical protein GCM10010841_11200 [Deinococcus aerophilus]